MKKIESKSTYLILFLTAVGAMLLCTKSSPLYPINDWLDANAFFTVGKGMFNGMVPYRDLYDHKGPILYVLHGIAWMISNKDFFGVWILEIIACYFLLLYSYKTICLFCEKRTFILMPLLAAIIYSSNHMRHGDSVEEFCLPLLAYALYISLKYFLKKEEIKNSELIVLGITSACVLWTKYTILGFYIGWFILPAIVQIFQKKWKELGRMILMIGIGVMITTIPVLVYFAANHALTDLFTVYFYNNIFVYAGEKAALTEVLIRTVGNVAYAAHRNRLIFGMIFIGIVWILIKKEYMALLQILFSAGVLVMTVLSAETVHGYYSLCFSPFGAFGVCAIWNVLEKIGNKVLNRKVSVICIGFLWILAFAGMFGISYTQGYNTYLLAYDKEDIPQYQFAEIINQSENPTVLNYGDLDLGIYTTTGLLPTCRYFCELNIDLEEMRDEQRKIVEQGEVEYVVTRNAEYDWPLYEKIAESCFIFEGKDRVFYLYQLKE